MTHDPTFWLIARAAGLAAYGLLTATVLAGLALKSRLLSRVKPASVTDVHRFLSLTALLAVGVHLAALVVDTAVEVTIPGVFVPGIVDYRPLWTSLGVVAFELMLIIHVSFRLMKRIGRRNWRRLHYLTYVVWSGTTAHGLMTGTDSSRQWALAIYGLAACLVIGLTWWRLDAVRAAARTRAAVRTDARETADSAQPRDSGVAAADCEVGQPSSHRAPTIREIVTAALGSRAAADDDALVVVAVPVDAETGQPVGAARIVKYPRESPVT